MNSLHFKQNRRRKPQIYNMDIGWGLRLSSNPPEQQAILDGLYDMMDHERGAKLPFDVILSDLVFDGLETVTLTATQRSRLDGTELHTESVSMTLGELFG